MKLKIVKNYQELSELSAKIVSDAVNKKPASVLVLATGNTPLGMFERLVAKSEQGLVDFKNCKLVELDEYYGISLADERNLFNWLERTFINKAGIKAENILRFDSLASDPSEECKRIERVLEAWGGIDLQVLGLGPNGHLGFNEPGSSFNSKTRLIDLSLASVESSARYWGGSERVPRNGMTLGLRTLSSSKETILMVSGESKAEILKQVVSSQETPELPATILKKFANVSIIADQQAAKHIKF